ncbi:hypothetical protein AAUPMB_02801 [Pasteurella multocida subsp. multocida str. Anand1_buffalo]|nr:hypothetical protein AAUPMB_02801 [Pasteurella multocida subsp. multocida str. Anand1_buffalo]
MLKIKSFKFAQLALLFSCACSTSVFANQEPLPTPIIDTVQEADLLTRQQLELETKAIRSAISGRKETGRGTSCSRKTSARRTNING